MKKIFLFSCLLLFTSLDASAQMLQNQSSVKFVQASAGISDEYLTNLLTRISKYWVTSKLSHQLHCELEFQVNTSGQIVKAGITKSSGDPTFDNDALESAKIAAPFPPPQNEFLVMITMDNLNLNDSVLRQNQQRQLKKIRSASQTSPDSLGLPQPSVNQPSAPIEKQAFLKASVEKSWTKPIQMEELRSLDEYAIAQYKIWLIAWIKQPLEVRYPDIAKDLARLPH